MNEEESDMIQEEVNRALIDILHALKSEQDFLYIGQEGELVGLSKAINILKAKLKVGNGERRKMEKERTEDPLVVKPGGKVTGTINLRYIKS